ncbi:helix-turn-helix domain-containing protein [Acidobacteria bacterium AH-259-A15]|nr:helix-turn-helix domain-containing protein [Acidobacteria bacterium AH-259-A15]
MISIKFLRLLRRQSQFDLSLETRIPTYRLSNIENGKVEPKPNELKKLAAALETTVEVLEKEISQEMLASA